MLESRFSSRTRRRLDLIFMNLALTLILAEVALRILSLVWPSPLLVTESTSSQIRRDSERMAPGSERFSFPINSSGHYDTDFLPPSERSLPLVVTIGDSFSYGVVPHYYHYTTVAEREFPGAEVYNIGFPGTNPVDYLYHLVEEALPLQPDLVVIAL
ncbi:MAG: SGNH/GDSL hydrolase family protein [Haliea sp.]|nr:SGNH/GDSL hydrolase family protein [Haliea sp.]